MNKPHIEQSDRGVVLNKSLAWTIVVGLVMAGIWTGSNLSEIRTEMVNLKETVNETRAARQTIDARVRILENGQSASTAIANRLERDVQEIKTEQRTTNELLGQIAQKVNSLSLTPR